MRKGWVTATVLFLGIWLAGGGNVGARDVEWDFYQLRKRMIKHQLQAVGRDIKNEAVIEAMMDIPRHKFVPEEVREQSYADRPLPIGYDQTISQPYIVALMTERLEPKKTDRVLEIGTGSGYQAAVLSRLVKDVYSIEIVMPLADRAKKALANLGIENVQVRGGDGYQGWPEEAPFDAIIVTCAPERIPQPLIDQLKDGGRMIIPVGRGGGAQDLYLLEKKGDEVVRKVVLPVRFVPMTGEVEKAPAEAEE